MFQSHPAYVMILVKWGTPELVEHKSFLLPWLCPRDIDKFGAIPQKKKSVSKRRCVYPFNSEREEENYEAQEAWKVHASVALETFIFGIFLLFVLLSFGLSKCYPTTLNCFQQWKEHELKRLDEIWLKHMLRICFYSWYIECFVTSTCLR